MEDQRRLFKNKKNKNHTKGFIKLTKLYTNGREKIKYSKKCFKNKSAKTFAKNPQNLMQRIRESRLRRCDARHFQVESALAHTHTHTALSGISN